MRQKQPCKDNLEGGRHLIIFKCINEFNMKYRPVTRGHETTSYLYLDFLDEIICYDTISCSCNNERNVLHDTTELCQAEYPWQFNPSRTNTGVRYFWAGADVLLLLFLLLRSKTHKGVLFPARVWTADSCVRDT